VTDQLETDVLRAGIALLQLDSALNLQEGKVTNLTPRPYVLVQTWTQWPEDADSNALDYLSRTLEARWYVHCVGDTRESASAMAQRARTQLLDKLLTLTGRPTVAFTLIKQESALQPTLDESTGVPVFDAISVYKTRVTI